MKSSFDEDCSVVADFTNDHMHFMIREPGGVFPLPYLVPGSAYSRSLWDWDALFVGVAIGEGQYAPYFEGAMRTLLHFQQEDGFIPHAVSARPPHVSKSRKANPCKPIIAQGLVISLSRQNKRIEDQPWSQDAYQRLKRYYEYLDQHHTERRGFITLMNQTALGTDNIPTVYGRPPHSTAPMFHNCLFLRELTAVAKIANALGHTDDAEQYRSKHARLAEAINHHAWDPIDGLYYDQDVLSKTPPKVNQEVTWTLPLKIRAWTCFLPILAKIAPADRAGRMIDEHLLDPDSFWSDYGVRTLSKLEPLFLNAIAGIPGNPSNWQGPIWFVANYLIFRCLMYQGRRKEAEILAERSARLLADDIRKTGTSHEFYNTETGEPFCNPDFLNWNLLVLTMQRELQTGVDSISPGDD